MLTLGGKKKGSVKLTTMVPTPVRMSTPNEFIELVRLFLILDARLFA